MGFMRRYCLIINIEGSKNLVGIGKNGRADFIYCIFSSYSNKGRFLW